MSEAHAFATLLPWWIALATVMFVVLLVRRAPYGRHATASAGPTLDARLGWVLMEFPSPLLMIATFATGRHRGATWAWVFLSMWLVHYANRTLVQPLRWRGTPTPIPLAIALSGALFNAINGYTNGRWLFELGTAYGPSWFADARFVAGLALFVTGMGINVYADEVLRGLRRAGDGGYKIPRGGVYRFVSCPNYLGEIVEWSGFALCAWSLPALAFAAWTTANLMPRALAHHRWYKQRFADYPPERRAVVPFVL